MKTILKFLTLVPFYLMLFTLSCAKETDNQSTISRIDFLKNKNQTEIKDDYNKLVEQQQLELWLDKLEHLRNQENSIAFHPEINELSNILTSKIKNGGELDLARIEKIAITLAKKLPNEVFYQCFTELNNYEIPKNIESKVKINNQLIAELGELSNSNIVNNNYKSISIDDSTQAIKDCNCRWSCDLGTGPGCITTTCRVVRGCGFFGLMECTTKVGLTPLDCY